MKYAGRDIDAMGAIANAASARSLAQYQSVTSTYSAELVTGEMATELILEYQCLIRMMGTDSDGPAVSLGDNNSVVMNCSMPNSALKKKHSAIAHHGVKATIASSIVKFLTFCLSTIVLTF